MGPLRQILLPARVRDFRGRLVQPQTQSPCSQSVSDLVSDPPAPLCILSTCTTLPCVTCIHAVVWCLSPPPFAPHLFPPSCCPCATPDALECRTLLLPLAPPVTFERFVVLASLHVGGRAQGGMRLERCPKDAWRPPRESERASTCVFRRAGGPPYPPMQPCCCVLICAWLSHACTHAVAPSPVRPPGQPSGGRERGMAGLHDPCSHPAATRLALKLVEEQFGETCRVSYEIQVLA